MIVTKKSIRSNTVIPFKDMKELLGIGKKEQIIEIMLCSHNKRDDNYTIHRTIEVGMGDTFMIKTESDLNG